MKRITIYLLAFLVFSVVAEEEGQFEEYFSVVSLERLQNRGYRELKKKEIPISNIPEKIKDFFKNPDLRFLNSLAKSTLTENYAIYLVSHNGCEDASNGISLVVQNNSDKQFTDSIELSDYCEYEGSTYTVDSWFVDLNGDGVSDIVRKSKAYNFALEDGEKDSIEKKTSVFLFNQKQGKYNETKNVYQSKTDEFSLEEK